ncbi:MAG: hypothetical protein J6U92_02870 [Clostridia bacterium]|nr:hypothetical protein [Clostridia bacterium]
MCDFIKDGQLIIQKQIENTIKNGKAQCVISGNYEISSAIVLPSNFTIILSDCHLKLAEGVFCNIFTNYATANALNTAKDSDTNIHILGQGKALLDGGVFNGLTERNAKELGKPMTVNNLILFTNLENFSIKNISLCNQRWWSINLMYCRNGHIANIDIVADDSILYVGGYRHDDWGYMDLVMNHLEMLRNADGVDVRIGCHDLLIENITGFTEDDTVALTGLYRNTASPYAVKDLPCDIYSVIIRNVKSSSWCANVRLLNQGGVKLYNVLIDGLVDTSKGSKHMNRGLYGVRIGDNHMYDSRHSTPEETYNIVVKNIFSRANQAVNLAGSITDCKITDVFPFDGCPVKIKNDAKLYGNCVVEE